MCAHIPTLDQSCFAPQTRSIQTSRHAAVLAMVTAALMLGGCGPTQPDETMVPTEQVATAVPVPPTAVARVEPSPTPTIDPAVQPYHQVESDVLSGVPVPLAATLVSYEPAGNNSDARAEYAMPDFDEEQIYEWYEQAMTDFGWSEPEDRDGSLVFLHGTELSHRFADEGMKRTATVLFYTLDEDADWTLIVEAPTGENVDRDNDGNDGDEDDGENSDGDEDDGEDADDD